MAMRGATVLSIIIPVYNSEKYLHRCLDSIFQQSFKDYELILVNDGSTDSSLCICRQYAEKDNRVKIIDQTNRGVSAARNAGILMARGEWITFIDSDDWIGENYFTILDIDLNEDLIVGTIFINQCQVLCKLDDVKVNAKIGDCPIFTADQLSSTLFNGPCAKFYRRSIIYNNNLRFDEKLCFGEDAVFVKKYLLLIDNYSTHTGIIYYYDDIGDNIYKKYSRSFAPIWDYYTQICVLLRKLEQKYKVILSRKELVGMVYNIAIECLNKRGLEEWENIRFFLCDNTAGLILRQRNSSHINNLIKLACLNKPRLFITYYRITYYIKEVRKIIS